ISKRADQEAKIVLSFDYKEIVISDDYAATKCGPCLIKECYLCHIKKYEEEKAINQVISKCTYGRVSSDKWKINVADSMNQNYYPTYNNSLFVGLNLLFVFAYVATFATPILEFFATVA